MKRLKYGKSERIKYKGKEYWVKLKEERGKTRRGLHLYINQVGKNKGREYKLEEGITAEDCLEMYAKSQKTKEKGLKSKRKIIESVKKKSKKRWIKRKKELESAGIIVKGSENSVTLNDVQAMSENEVENGIKNLFRPFIKDEEMLRILTQESNLEQIKHRITTILYMNEKTGEQIGNINAPNQSVRGLISRSSGLLGETVVSYSPGENEINATMIKNLLNTINTPKIVKNLEKERPRIERINVTLVLSK